MNNPKESKVSPELSNIDLVFGESAPFQQFSFQNSPVGPLTPKQPSKGDKSGMTQSFFVGDRTQGAKGYSYQRKMYAFSKT